MTHDSPADAAAPGIICKPWGVWTTIGWVIAAEAIRNVVDFGLDRVPLLTHGHPWHDLMITVSWATPLAVLAAAVRLARCSFRDYFAWKLPRLRHIVLAVVLVLALEFVGHGLPYLAGGSVAQSYPIEDYRALIGPGRWPWMYVLIYWPAAIYAPFVEETIYRGFLWRGVAASRLGNWGALLLTSFLFAAVHYHYFIQNGVFIPGPLIGEFIAGLLLGVVRWRSGSTIASMVAHSLSNIALSVGTVLAVTQGWP